jgi:Rad3-related DNA helicase
LQRGKIVLAEGGTGLGKSRVIALAAHAALSHGIKVVVAAPSILVLNQILDGEWQYLTPPGRSSALLLGRRQFVDPNAVLTVLSAPESEYPGAEAIRDWIASGGPSTAPLSLMRGPLAFLREELERIDPTFPAGECLADGSNEQIEEQVQRMREAAAAADAVFVTHAAVASSLRVERFGRDAIVPLAGRSLLVDEAHLLEGFMASAASTGLSVFHARLRLQAHLATMPVTRSRHRAAVAHVIEELRRWSTPGGEGLSSLPRRGGDTLFIAAERGDQPLRRGMTALIESLAINADLLRKAGGYADEFAGTLASMSSALKGETGMVVQLSLGDTRRSPSALARYKASGWTSGRAFIAHCCAAVR